MPFLQDYEVHARLLFALPLMILAETIVHLRMRSITAQFLERQIIIPSVVPRFNAAISSAMRLRNSLTAEIGLLLLVIFAGHYVWSGSLALKSDTWYATALATRRSYTQAGYWYEFVSIPLFQFILVRWYYRLFIWCRFLFQVSRLDLNLVALHPDRCCGLGFLATVNFAFAPLLMAHSGLMAGFIANRILHEGATLPRYRMELVGMAVFLLIIVLGPLSAFIPKLNSARIAGLRTYGRLASDYVVDFARKWRPDATSRTESILGSGDIQSLADLGNSFAVVMEIKLVPFGKDTVMRFLVVIALPLIPLAFTMFSPEELLQRLVKVVF